MIETLEVGDWVFVGTDPEELVRVDKVHQYTPAIEGFVGARFDEGFVGARGAQLRCRAGFASDPKLHRRVLASGCAPRPVCFSRCHFGIAYVERHARGRVSVI